MTRGHCLLIPKVQAATVLDMDEESTAAVLRELPRLARAVVEATGCAGMHVLQNNGDQAMQTVFHVHFHLIPRYGSESMSELAVNRRPLDFRDAEVLTTKVRERLTSGPSASRSRL
eukprot:SRR837773.14620.p1 GENE.SRR837773.14620~~SRR837773.14620.p1  ORF type:complete len:136 (+),score=47.42 SRR837773.14620:61-408(+)